MYTTVCMYTHDRGPPVYVYVYVYVCVYVYVYVYVCVCTANVSSCRHMQMHLCA